MAGILVSSTIIFVWLTSLFSLLNLKIYLLHPGVIMLAICWQTFLYTGLFITAHEAMHGLVCSQNLQINHLIGAIAVSLYAFFPYKKLLLKHWLHHRYPATPLDPDFHDGTNTSFWRWYFHFLKGYGCWQQLGSLIISLSIIKYELHIPAINLALFILIPSIFSSLQLFYFGTFLPHREPQGGYCYPHRSQSHALPRFWSFIACYHFGYHQEHHEHPQAPWWQLPEIYRQSKEGHSASFDTKR
jgi:beta-carotene ketolase (CrtW type)